MVFRYSRCAYDVWNLSKWLVGNETRGLVGTFGNVHHVELKGYILFLEDECYTKCASRGGETVQLQDHCALCCGCGEEMNDMQTDRTSSFYRISVRQLLCRRFVNLKPWTRRWEAP